jgi:hemoglobin
MNDEVLTRIHAAVGGDEPFFRLVGAFYAGIENEPLIRPMYPQDMTKAKEHLALFLIQRVGERDAWLRHMLAAVDATPEFHPFRDDLREYFEESANFLVNAEA